MPSRYDKPTVVRGSTSQFKGARQIHALLAIFFMSKKKVTYVRDAKNALTPRQKFKGNTAHIQINF